MNKIVGRAELKLAEAVKDFCYDFRGKTVLDIGSSTGGFTELALEQGAKRVYAIEKGTNQMAKPLRYDPRIILMEKTDIFEVMVAKQRPEMRGHWMVVADVSFVSLTKVLNHVKRQIASKNTDYLIMLKPQFEAQPWQLVNGVVKNERMRRDIMKDFEQWLVRNGFLIVQKHDNELTGKNGNRERFYFLRLARGK